MTGITRTAGHQYSFNGSGPFPGVTGIIKLQDALGGSDGLLNWGVGLALDTVESQAKWIQDDWPKVRRAAIAAKDLPMLTGSAVHAAVDSFNRGLPLHLTETTAPYIAQYGALIVQRGIEILGSEKYVINSDIGFGGTYDSLCCIDGEVALVDVKTGKERISQRLQLAGLSLGQFHGDADEEPERMPKVDVAYILLLRPDGHELIRHEITQADLDHFTSLVETYHRVREWTAKFVPTVVKEAA